MKHKVEAMKKKMANGAALPAALPAPSADAALGGTSALPAPAAQVDSTAKVDFAVRKSGAADTGQIEMNNQSSTPPLPDNETAK